MTGTDRSSALAMALLSGARSAARGRRWGFRSVVSDLKSGVPQVFGEFGFLMAGHEAVVPRRIRRAANDGVDHPDEIASDPLAALAFRAGTHLSEFVRPALDPGFDGFSERGGET